VQGFEGGREAAHELLANARNVTGATSATKIFVHVFANATSLSIVLAQSGVIPKVDFLHEFVNGFNTVDELVTFVNVGRGKELTDSKINGSPPCLCH
jgi:hypothetical protein